MKTLIILLLFNLLYQGYPPEKYPEINNNDKVIINFIKSIEHFNPTKSKYKFNKTVIPFLKEDPSYGKLITFTFQNDTIQYYKSGDKQFLYYCKFENITALSEEIPFFLKNKKNLTPNKFIKYNSVTMVMIGGLEYLDVVFSGGNIKKIAYRVYPD